TITRLDRNLMLAVNEHAPFDLTATIDKATVTQGDKPNVTLKLKRVWPDFKTPLQVQPLELAQVRGQPVIVVPPVTMAPGKDEAKVAVDVRPNIAPGTYNLAFRGQTQFPYNKDPKAPQKPATNVVLPSTPLTLTVLPKQLAAVKLPAPTVTAPPGGQGEVVVQVARMHNFAGEFKVKLVLPPNLKGLGAAEAVIPAGKDEAKLALKIAPDALAAADDKPAAKGVQPIKVVTLERKEPVLYEKDVEPIFVSKCLVCHSGSVKEGKFDLGAYESLMRGGKRGKPIVPGKSAESLL